MKKILSILLCIGLMLCLFSCKVKERTTKSYVEVPEEDRKYSFNFFAFDTLCNITLYGDTVKANGEALKKSLTDIVKRNEERLSKTLPNSDIYAINHRTTDTVMVSDMAANLLIAAKDMNQFTEGRFDITSGTLVDLWDIKNRKTVPTLAEINEARKHCNNYNYEIEFDRESEDLLCNKITFSGDTKTQFDLGALVKGFCCEGLKQTIAESDAVEAAIINLGGNVCCVGEVSNRKGGAFNVGIFKPFDGQEIIDTVKVKDRCVITSGNYQRYFKVDGNDTIYHHILDPLTGYPADTGLNSVTIISVNGTLGDFLSTACMLLGPEKSKDLIDFCSKAYEDKNLQAIFVDYNNKVTKYPKKVTTY